MRATLLIVPLLLTFRLLQTAQMRDAVQVQVKAGHPTAPARVWPPDPDLLYWGGEAEEAARIEPSGKRFYRLGQYLANARQYDAAVAAFRQAVAADPNAFQSWRRLAETQEQAGDAAGALVSWRELIRRYEGPAGQVRAIPEMTETHPAFAYAAVARATARGGDTAAARRAYEKAAEIIEAYASTGPLYQRMEVISALTGGTDVARRRREARDLYEGVLRDWAALAPDQRAALARRRDETLARLDALASPDAPDALGGKEK